MRNLEAIEGACGTYRRRPGGLGLAKTEEDELEGGAGAPRTLNAPSGRVPLKYRLKVLSKIRPDGYFRLRDARASLYEKEENYRTDLEQKF